MKETRIGDRYAKALFDFALEKDKVERIYEDIVSILQVCETSKEFRLFLASPIIRYDKKIAVLSDIFKSSIDIITFEYLKIITKRRRESYIQDISKQFIVLYKKYKGIVTVVIRTAVKIDDKLRNRILKVLENQTHAQIELIEEVDADLIGGFVIKMGDNQYDASLLKQIKKLRRDFDENVFIKGY